MGLVLHGPACLIYAERDGDAADLGSQYHGIWMNPNPMVEIDWELLVSTGISLQFVLDPPS